METQSKYTLLLVDDEPTFLEPVAEVLSMDYNVLTASGVDEAIQALQNNAVDAVLTDFRMSPKSGLELLKHMQDTGHRALRLLITANRQPAMVESDGKIRVDEFIDKPVDLMRLIPHLEAILKRP